MGREEEHTLQEQLIKRKESHIKIPLQQEVEAKATSTYLEHVHLVHNALPEVNFSEIDTSTTFLNHRFGAPILIDAMTGGTPLAGEINATLAEAAEEFKLGMAVGSQRAGLQSPEAAETFAVARKHAPSIFLAANVGGAQLAKGLSVADAEQLIQMVNANALVIHLNPLQELIQPEGEPEFRGVYVKIQEFASQLKVPIIVKEVGAGLSREVAVKLELTGVAAVNVAGVGGTSWAGVEQIRATKERDELKAQLGLTFWDWGIPTAAALLEVKRAVGIPVIASGGLRTGLDVAKCIALGGSLCGMALPMLRAASKSKDELRTFIQQVFAELKAAMYLVGASNIAALSRARHVITGPLAEWLRAIS